MIELENDALGLGARLAEVPLHGQRRILGLARTEADLHSVVTVARSGLDLGHDAGAGLDHRHGDVAPVFVEDARHTDLLADQSVHGCSLIPLRP